MFIDHARHFINFIDSSSGLSRRLFFHSFKSILIFQKIGLKTDFYILICKKIVLCT